MQPLLKKKANSNDLKRLLQTGQDITTSLEKEFTSESSYLSPEMPGNGLYLSIVSLFFLQGITIFHDLNDICNDV